MHVKFRFRPLTLICVRDSLSGRRCSPERLQPYHEARRRPAVAENDICAELMRTSHRVFSQLVILCGNQGIYRLVVQSSRRPDSGSVSCSDLCPRPTIMFEHPVVSFPYRCDALLDATHAWLSLRNTAMPKNIYVTATELILVLICFGSSSSHALTDAVLAPETTMDA